MTTLPKRKGCTLTTGIGIVLLGLVAYLIKTQILDAFQNVTDVGKYESIVAQYGLTRNLFPERVPPRAEDIFFFHCPGAMQAPSIVSFRCKLPKSELLQIEENLRRSGRAPYEIQPQGYPTNAFDPKQRESVRVFHTELPKGFTVYMHDTDHMNCVAPGNRGTISYAAISYERGEVVFHFHSG